MYKQLKKGSFNRMVALHNSALEGCFDLQVTRDVKATKAFIYRRWESALWVNVKAWSEHGVLAVHIKYAHIHVAITG